jgi:GMP synthase (glutamine-hydrolysing)
MADEERRFYGVQFHPEVTHTLQGKAILARFVHEICGCGSDWNMPDYVDEAIGRVRSEVGSDEVILGLSGGVDSSVVAALAAPRHRQPAHLRLRRQRPVAPERGRAGDADLRRQPRRQGHPRRCQRALHGPNWPASPTPSRSARSSAANSSTCSRKKPKSCPMPNGWRRAPSTRTSSNRPAPRPRRRTPSRATTTSAACPTLHLKLLEPLRELFKDEVRELGIALGLPHDMVYRHPFPGPGLGVRILGEVKREYADLLRRADAIFIEELRASGWYEKTSQAFAVFLPVKSVGVMGDGRTYDYVVALRAVVTSDFMTAHWAELPYTLLGKVSNRIINEVRGINRVVYDISGKPPATIEWE